MSVLLKKNYFFVETRRSIVEKSIKNVEKIRFIVEKIDAPLYCVI